MNPKGKLLIIGGAEDKGNGKDYPDMDNKNIRFRRYEILKELLSASQGKPIEIITAGSRTPNAVKKSYEKAFDRMDYGQPRFLPIKSQSDARLSCFVDRIEKAGAVFFTGGDQFRLTSILAHSPICQSIKMRYQQDSNFLLAGTSAGAMALTDRMIISGGHSEAIYAYDLQMAKGFNILPNYIIDTHFIKRGRFIRLAHAIAMYPEHLGIGLGEDTALIISQGKAECRGSGAVVIIDGSKIKQTNVCTSKKDEPIFMENLKVHIMVKGCKFSFKTKEIS